MQSSTKRLELLDTLSVVSSTRAHDGARSNPASGLEPLGTAVAQARGTTGPLWAATPGLQLRPGFPAKAEIVRLVDQHIERIAEKVEDPEASFEECCQDLRSCCRKIRACLELVAAADESWYEREKEILRRLARALPRPSELERMGAALDDLLARHGPEIPPGNAVLNTRFPQTGAGKTSPARTSSTTLPDGVAELRRSADRFRSSAWELSDPAVILDGVRQGYRKARAAFAQAAAEESDEALEGWRKAVSLHRIHVQLFRLAWPVVMGAWRKELTVLKTLLTEHRDLGLLAPLPGRSDATAPFLQVDQRVFELAAGKRLVLRERAFELGQKLFAEKPRAIDERLALWWKLAGKRAGMQARTALQR